MKHDNLTVDGKNLDWLLAMQSSSVIHSSSMTDNLFGFNHQPNSQTLIKNRDVQGYVFFVRPQFNLRAGNVRNDTKLYDLLNNSSTSLGSYIRTTLDPRLEKDGEHQCPLVNESLGMIPLLTNAVKVVSGWPDEVLAMGSTEKGIRQQEQFFTDGILDIYSSFDLDVVFTSVINDPILMMFASWLRVMANQNDGIMYPYLDYITEDEFNFNTRIYRLVMSPDGKKVSKIAATGASVPMSIPTGAVFNYNREQTYAESNDEIPVRFKCDGATYHQKILFREFNETNYQFDEGLRTKVGFTKVSDAQKDIFNHRMIPIINEDTNELEWYVKNEIYNRVMEEVTNNEQGIN